MTLYLRSLCRNMMTNNVMPRVYLVYLTIMYTDCQQNEYYGAQKLYKVDVADISH